MSEQRFKLEELLQAGQSAVLTPRGHSMEPLLHPGSAQVVVEPLCDKPARGDILLFHRRDGRYILHRMIGEDEIHYLLRGDHGTYINHANKSRVIGVVSEINRGKGWFPVTSHSYRLYVRIWMLLYPLRACFYRISGKI